VCRSWVALLQGGPSTGIIYWNSFTRAVTFLALGVFVALLRRDRDELHAMNNRLQLALEQESDLARTDALTDLPNARSFREQLAHELARSKRDGIAIAIGYLDLDNFKQVNDRFGHDVGDEVLRRTAKAISESVREVDLAARIGGDEFAIVIVDPADGACERVGQRILEQLESIALRYPRTGLGVTIGFASFQSPPADVEALLKRADDTMYEVKAKGKGRLEVVQY
jgi:diguanylate cyclase (GGDEF)-like protein